MNLILVEDADVGSDGLARLTGRRARHVREVHRAQAGDELAVGRIGGLVGRGTVVAASPEEVVLSLALGEPPPPKTGVELLLAMPRPKILRKVLQAAASLGIARIALVNSCRVEKSYFDSPLLAPEALREQLVLGLEQGRDTVLPELRVEKRFKPFVEDSLDAVWAGARRLVAHPVDAPELRPGLAGRESERVVVAIGPEGGWVPFEVELLEAHGFARFGLGPRILRVDVAVPYIAAQVELARRLAPVAPLPQRT